MNDFLSGMTSGLCLVAGLFFLRFWRKTGDRFFGFFAASFGMMALHRVMMMLLRDSENEHVLKVYLIRLLSFVLILVAIADKNWARPRGKRRPAR
ncbi:hypothetical protein D187_006922 [Cystobacter fuscus DSM 2262]|uniref:Uncharacterized protein n=1 Tax=Cystobacter fuscus (strain ATCC 25194 / DSM 2262 / NBRC 100088 / M29) TaxID=1242864 RepID=S9QL29_CYSF2|nr:DUF5985 family protein [Cystobacter fuscus]EPX57168.1 hypothetical protein D187_006922 [Cystobacter fuscus DSM 2262]